MTGMELQVLVVTMHQKDLTIVDRMNIRQNAIIANQCGVWAYEEIQRDDGVIQMISSATVGVGRNRNLALQLAQADILLFADDDVSYYDGTLQGVIDAFREQPDADVIFFGLDITNGGIVTDHYQDKRKRLHFWNSLKYGAPRMAVRRSSIQKHRIVFSLLFGGGSPYGSGEDSLLILDCFRNGLKVYAHPYVLGTCAQDTSSWFTGYNEKYIFDIGAFVAAAFPKTKYFMKFYYIWRNYRRTEIPLRGMLKYMNMGMAAYGQQCTFSEMNQGQMT